MKNGQSNTKFKNWNVRPIKVEDDSLIAEIIRTNLKKFHLDIPGTVYFDPGLDYLSQYYESLPDKRGYFIATCEDGQVIGGVGVAEFDGFENCAELQKLYLIDQAKGKGMGRYLLQVAEDFARRAGYKSLYLETHTNLATAIRLYERNGFVQIAKPEAVVHSTMNRFYIKRLCL